jgi:hypothetical protein
MNIRRWRQFDFSLGVQEATTWLMKKPNELARGINLKFTETVGGYQRRDGFVVSGDPFATNLPPHGAHIAKFTTGAVPFVAVNNDAGTATIIRTQNSTTGAWTTLPTISYPVNSIVFFTDHLDEVYVSGFDPLTGDPIQPYNVDKTLDVSATRNILNMPAPYFIQEFLGLLYAANVKIGGTRYTDRVYKSSPPLGAITFVQGAQTDVAAPVTLIDNVPTMTGATTPFGAVSASTTFAGFNAYAAFDDNLTRPNSWFTTSGNTTGWVQYDFGASNSKVITYYSLVGLSTSPSAGDNAWSPKDWTFEGSNDALSWTVLNTQTSAPGWTAGEKRVYAVTNTTAYRYYRVNVSAIQATGGTNLVHIAEIELLTSTEGTKSLQLLVDSARYLKPGMAIDLYKAGTDTKMYDIRILGVDKPKNIITFDPVLASFAPADVTIATDTITIPDNGPYPTGSPVKIDSSAAVPGGLTANTIYYAIQVSNNTATAIAGTGVDDASTGSVAWSNPGNVTADDASVATAVLPGPHDLSHYLKATNFGFAIPVGATINGIEATVERSSDGAGIQVDSIVSLVKGGVIGAVNRAVFTSIPGSSTAKTFGSPSDLWGVTLTPADVNAANFGFVYAGGEGTFKTISVDRMNITVYYTLNNGIKLATSLNNAKLGNAIDITSQGSGTHRLKLSYVFGDNDEIWLDDRKGKLTMLWNTDYPTPETAEYLAIKPGTDSSNTVSGIAKSSNRLFIFTKNSGTRWDGQNLVVFNNSVGCISHRSIRNIDDDWLIWVDAKGNVRARNENASQQENISRPVRNRYLRKLTMDQLKAVSGGLSDNVYKLYLGQINGENIRLAYDFDANTWSPERLGKQALMSGTADFTGVLKPYFFAENGKMYIDETGNLDDDQAIPMEAGTGRDMFGSEQIKKYDGMLIYSENANGYKVMAAVDGGSMKTIGRIDRKVCYMKFPENGDNVLPEGTSFDWQIVGSIEGDAPKVEGAVVYYTPREDLPSERR